MPDSSGFVHAVDSDTTTLLSNFPYFPFYSHPLPPSQQLPVIAATSFWVIVASYRFLRHSSKRSKKICSFKSVQLKMSTVVDAMSQLFNFPETLEKHMFNSRAHETNENRGVGSIPVDILDTPKEYIFYMDVPGLSKSDIQVTVEDENTLVIRSNGKRKREDGEEEGCKYIRLERRAPQKLLRQFRLPDNCNVSAITAKCENGALTVVVEKLPPPSKSKTVEVAVS